MKRHLEKLPSLLSFVVLFSIVLSGCGSSTSSSPGDNKAGQPPAPKLEKKILVVFPSAGAIRLKNGKGVPTGFYLNEFAVPAKKLIAAGYKLVLATPNGFGPVLDASSDSPKYFSSEAEYKEAKLLIKTVGIVRREGEKDKKLLDFGNVRDEGFNSFAGLFVPGGHAPLMELARDHTMGQMLHYFHGAKKPTGMICHGVAALLSAFPEPEHLNDALVAGDSAKAVSLAADWIYKGYKVTGFSNAEEKEAEAKLGGPMPYSLENSLKTLGAKVSVGDKFKSNVVVYEELVTGQNPASAKEFANMFVKVLGDYWSDTQKK